MSAETVSTFLNERPVRRRQVALLLLVLSVMVLDGLDLQLLAFAAPAILVEWSVDKASFGPALAAAVVGMAVGTGIGGWLGDRWGRRRVTLGSMLLFGAMTLAASIAWNIPSMTLLRFISGLGFGAATPNVFTLANEIFPTRSRSRVTALMAIGTPLGGMVGGGVALAIIHRFGWEGCFILCGTVTLLLFIVAVRWLPESPAYLLSRGQADKAARALTRITGETVDPASITSSRLSTATDPAAPSSDAAQRPLAAIFTRANLRLNLGSWMAYFCYAFVSYAFISWLPALLRSAGFTLENSIRAGVVYNLLAILGALLAAWVLDRLGSRATLLIAAISAAAALLVMPLLIKGGASGDTVYWLAMLTAIGVIGVSAGFAVTACYALSVYAYPVHCRAVGMGLSAASARAGGIMVIVNGGIMLTIGKQDPSLFLMTLVVASAFLAFGTLLIDRHIAPMRRRRSAGLTMDTPVPLSPRPSDG